MDELAELRSEMKQLLLAQPLAPAAALNAAAPPAPSSAGSAAAPAAATLQGGVGDQQLPPGAFAVAQAFRSVDSGSSSVNDSGSSSASGVAWGPTTRDELFQGSSASPVSAKQAAPPAAARAPAPRAEDIPPHAASIAAALAAVDRGDVLADIDLAAPSRRASSSTSSSATTAGNANGSSAAAAAPAAQLQPQQQQAPAAAIEPPPDFAVETQKAPPDGPPPLLSCGDDDIFWVANLHDRLVASGFYPHDEEVDNWLFGETTEVALLAYQACEGLAETGACWDGVLASAPSAIACTVADCWCWACQSWGCSPCRPRQRWGQTTVAAHLLCHRYHTAPVGVADDATWARMLDMEVTVESHNGSSSVTMVVEASVEAVAAAAPSTGSGRGRNAASAWPMLMDMDGGREVHALQVREQRAAGVHASRTCMGWCACVQCSWAVAGQVACMPPPPAVPSPAADMRRCMLAVVPPCSHAIPCLLT